ncbi:methyltransferase domain-containing protein [Bradyrhizobium sp. Gha]|uniref:methyltransferase domain-containing protein n=1 Tax=Bradyrhizobium sp. Gha TaxID=1855318 RepID=UPI0015A69EEC|nr:methyltransferase domain-containing protein [Bradyrhizobium sp. Gha]
MPFASRSFDVVLCQVGLQFFSDRPQAFREMARVLRASGRVGLRRGPRGAARWSARRTSQSAPQSWDTVITGTGRFPI